MSYLEFKYINLVSPRLERFKRKSGNLYNFRCPFCLDSNHNKAKARGYLFEREGKVSFFCHNCQLSYRFDTFLKRLDLGLYNEYNIEKLKSEGIRSTLLHENFKSDIRFDTSEAYKALSSLPKISQLSSTHPAKIYIKNRLIPNPFHAILRWCPKFYDWTNSLIPEKFGKDILKGDHGRIIIPFFNENNHFFAYQGRALDVTKNGLRYIAINLDTNSPMVWGVNLINTSLPIKVVEGPFDGMFLANTIALGGSNFGSLTKKYPIDKYIIIFDNEPRSSDAKKKILHAIDNGFRVVIWPDNIEAKDINEMVISGLTPDYLEYIIQSNTYTGLKAKLRLNTWSRT